MFYFWADKPVIKNKIVTIVNNTENAELIREIDSNPLSNISWYNRAELLDTQTSVKIANFTIKNASCVDTKNFTLSASNVVQRNVTSMVELIVNCKLAWCNAKVRSSIINQHIVSQEWSTFNKYFFLDFLYNEILSF